jgi:hypothetical protein
LRYVGSIPLVTFLLNQLKMIRTGSLGTLAPTKRDKNGTSFQYEKTCSNKNQQRQYKRVAWDHML